jgi:DHA2 family multidrug resistance protein-like MFS transporter
VIARDLGIDPATAIWAVNAYQIAVIISLLPLAALGDSLGYRRVFCAGLAVFTLASLACALSSSFSALIGARVLQGFGAAGIMSVNPALVRFIYPSRFLGRGLGTNALIVGVSSAASPTVAAGILSVASWPWLFYVNVPFGILAFLVASRTLPETPLSRRPFDGTGAVLNAVTFGLLIGGIGGLRNGDTLAYPLLLIAAGVAAGLLFVRHQTTHPVPTLPLDLLRIPVFALSIVTSVCSFAAQTSAYVALPFYFHDILQRSITETGFLMTPFPLAVAIVAPISGRLADRHSPGLLGGIGLALLTIGLASLALLPAEPSTNDVIWRLTICGLGFGTFQSPNNKMILTSAPRERSGGAGGMLSTARLLGQSLGASLVAAMFGLALHDPTSDVLWAGAALSAIGCLASLYRMRRGRLSR